MTKHQPMNKPFNIYEFLKKRPLSYSAINTFSDPVWGSPEKWYKVYILGERQQSAEMDFGSWLDKKIQVEKDFIPDHPRYKVMQHQFDVVYMGTEQVGVDKDGKPIIKKRKIHMTGKPDWIDFDKFLLADTKSGRVPWTKELADKTEQLTCYLFFTYISKRISPEKFTCRIHWVPTVRNEFGNFDVKIELRDKPVKTITFDTRRTMKDILNFAVKVNRVVLEMQEYVRNHE